MKVVPATARFYSARGIGPQASAGVAVDEELRRAGKTCCRHRASSFQASKSAGFRWGIPPAVHACYKLFWNWSGAVRFVSQDKGFVIWHLHNYCLVHIVSLWSLSIGGRIIFTTNELVDRIRNFKSNASLICIWSFYDSQNDSEEDFSWKTCTAGQIFYEKMRHRQDLSNKMRRRQHFLTESGWVLCPIDTVCMSYWYSM